MNMTAFSSGLRSNAEDTFNVQSIREALIFTGSKMKQQMPYFVGGSFLMFTKKPKFMDDLAPTATTRFFNILQAFNIGVDGIADDTVQFNELNYGVSAQTLSIATGVEDGTQNITVKMPSELKGNPISRYLEAWVTGTVDKYSGIGDYHGLIASGDLQWSPENHTCEFVYWTTGIGATSTDIEFTLLGLNMFPSAIPKAHHNSTHGTREHLPISISFRGQTVTNNDNVNALCAKYMDTINSNRQRAMQADGDHIEVGDAGTSLNDNQQG